MDIIKRLIQEAPYLKGAKIENLEEVIKITQPVVPVSGITIVNVELIFHENEKDNFILLTAHDENNTYFSIKLIFNQTYEIECMLCDHPELDLNGANFNLYKGYGKYFQRIQLNYLLFLFNNALDIQSQSFSSESLLKLQSAYKNLMPIYKDVFRFQEMFVKLQTISKQKEIDKKIERIDLMIQDLQKRFSKLIKKNKKMQNIGTTFSKAQILELDSDYLLIEEISKIEDLLFITHQLIRIREFYKHENKYPSLSELSRRNYFEDIFIQAIREQNREIFMKLLPIVSEKLTIHHLEFIYKEILFIMDDAQFQGYEYFIQKLVETSLLFKALLFMSTTHVFGKPDNEDYHYSYIGWCVAMAKYNRLIFMMQIGVPMNYFVLHVQSNETKRVYKIPFINYLIIQTDFEQLQSILKHYNPYLDIMDLDTDTVYFEKFGQPIKIPDYIIKDESTLLVLTYSCAMVLMIKQYHYQALEQAVRISPDIHIVVEAFSHVLFMICRKEHPLSDKTKIYLQNTIDQSIVYNSDDTPNLSDNLTSNTHQRVLLFIHQLIRDEAELEVDPSYHGNSNCLKVLSIILNEISPVTADLSNRVQNHFIKIINQLGENTNVVFNLSIVVNILIKEIRTLEDITVLQTHLAIVNTRTGMLFFGSEHLQPTTSNLSSTLS